MEERLKELKEKITSFVIENNIKKFEVYISRGVTIPMNVEIEIRVWCKGKNMKKQYKK